MHTDTTTQPAETEADRADRLSRLRRTLRARADLPAYRAAEQYAAEAAR